MVPKYDDCTNAPKPFNRRTIAVCGTGSIGKAAAIAAANIKTVLVVSYKCPDRQFTIDMDKLKVLNKEEFQKEVLTLAKAFGMTANRIVDILKTLQEQTERAGKSTREVAEAFDKANLGLSMIKMNTIKKRKSQAFYEEQKKQDRFRNRNMRKSRW